MEFNTVEELRAAFPDLLAQVETAAQAEGASAERNRIQSIENIQAAIGNPEMVHNAKFGEKPLTAEQLAFQAMQAQAAIGANVLGNLEGDAANSGAAGVGATPAPAGEPAPDSPEAMAAQAKADVEAFNKMKEVR